MAMRVKNIDIIIESDDDLFNRAEKVFSDLDDGRLPEEPKERLSFETLDVLRKILTRKRLELLHVIKHQQPRSIYELSKIVKRDMKNIRDDLAKLEKIGLIDLVRDIDDPRESIIPVIKYDKLLVGIEI